MITGEVKNKVDKIWTDIWAGGISYDNLSEADKARYEEDFTEDDGSLPDFIPSPKINTFVLNEKTVDTVIQDLMANGIHVAGGDRIGKTIIFAQNKQHAEFILKRFNHLYPLLKGGFAKLEPQAAMAAFSDFIDDQTLNQFQIVFVRKVIDYVVQNGYIENVTELMKPPFDKPQSFGKLFDLTKQQRLVEIVKAVKENAVRIG